MITIGDLYRRHARHNPHGIAVIHGETRITYADMLARVDAASRRLAREGVLSARTMDVRLGE